MSANLKRRRHWLAVGMFVFAIALAFGAGAVVAAGVRIDLPIASPASAGQKPSLQSVSRVPVLDEAPVSAAQIPVLVYHEMDNGCSASAATCKTGKDYESVSKGQFRAEMAWMHTNGYHTVTLAQYLQWLKRPVKTLLPRKPFLITVDNGIGNFLDGAEPILYHYRYQATAFLVTGFADGAEGNCAPKTGGINVQPGCPVANKDWDLTWQQIKALSPAVYSFGIEAGASGHFQQTYDKACNAFNACKLPGETDAAYEQRIQKEYAAGIAELSAKLGRRFDSGAWVVPYSDLGYRCTAYSCAYEKYTGPPGWLISYAARHFQAVFVQDEYRNGIASERFRYEVHNTTTLRQFRAALRTYAGLGGFTWRAER